MATTKDIYEHLVQQIVHDFLFRDPLENKAFAESPVTKVNSSSSTLGELEKSTEATIHPDSLLHLLINNDTQHDENPAVDEGDNNADVQRGSWIMDCTEWPVKRLREEKAAIKRYLISQRAACKKAPTLSSGILLIHEAYALLKLFLLERDPDYRQFMQQSIGCNNSFVTSLHVLLTLYATHFEHANGRQISKKTDVKPVETLYDLFLTASAQQQQQSQ